MQMLRVNLGTLRIGLSQKLKGYEVHALRHVASVQKGYYRKMEAA